MTSDTPIIEAKSEYEIVQAFVNDVPCRHCGGSYMLRDLTPCGQPIINVHTTCTCPYGPLWHRLIESPLGAQLRLRELNERFTRQAFDGWVYFYDATREAIVRAPATFFHQGVITYVRTGGDL